MARGSKAGQPYRSKHCCTQCPQPGAAVAASGDPRATASPCSSSKGSKHLPGSWWERLGLGKGACGSGEPRRRWQQEGWTGPSPSCAGNWIQGEQGSVMDGECAEPASSPEPRAEITLSPSQLPAPLAQLYQHRGDILQTTRSSPSPHDLAPQRGTCAGAGEEGQS